MYGLLIVRRDKATPDPHFEHTSRRVQRHHRCFSCIERELLEENHLIDTVVEHKAMIGFNVAVLTSLQNSTEVESNLRVARRD